MSGPLVKVKGCLDLLLGSSQQTSPWGPLSTSMTVTQGPTEAEERGIKGSDFLLQTATFKELTGSFIPSLPQQIFIQWYSRWSSTLLALRIQRQARGSQPREKLEN